MKKVLILIFFIAAVLFILPINSIYSQCSANAGSDRVICVEFTGMGSVLIGGSPTAQGGTPPYTYTWSCNYYMGNGTLHFTASDFLNDTTLPNPTIINNTADKLTLYLAVADNNGNTCIDSITLQFSKFSTTFEDKSRIINKGDSIQLYSGVGGGIPPLFYHWTPEYNISNPDISQPWVAPDSNTAYVVTIRDSTGCSVTDPDPFEVYVNNSTSVTEINKKQTIGLFIYPNPAHSQINIASPYFDIATIDFYSLHGQRKNIGIDNNNSKESQIDISSFPAGVYFLHLKLSNGAQYVHKIMKE